MTHELPRIRVIGMGLLPSQEDIVEFVRAGAAGFILKSATVEDLLRTIHSVTRGEIVRPPSLTGSLLTYVADRAFQTTKGKMPPAVRMTERERAVAIAVAGGASNKEISLDLGLSPHAVRSHINNILEKMALRSRFQITEQLRPARRT
jgi:DNA-binding NarL/FixJ family response regulator